MLKATQVDVKTCKNAARATNLANERFLYRNSCQRAAGKWIGIYYGEIRAPTRFTNSTNSYEGSRFGRQALPLSDSFLRPGGGACEVSKIRP